MQTRITQTLITTLATAVMVCACTPVSVTRTSDNLMPAHINHYVPVVSTAPSYEGYISNLYVREIPASGTATDVVLFVHGAGTPAEVAFDVPVQGYSWMRYLASRGLHSYSMDLTGYGRSTRPPVLNDRCNLSAEDQQAVFGNACPAHFSSAATTMASDWNDINAVVDFLLRKHQVERVHLVGWSQGGPRTAGYAAQHPEKIASIVLLAPAYSREYPATVSDELLAGITITKQTRSDFIANWDRQTGCTNQYDPAVAEVVFDEMLASDPVGATWGDGLRRAPRVPTFGWTPADVAATRTPVMMVAGLQDAQVLPERVSWLYEDLGSSEKVYIEMPCASHNAMWEKDAEKLFEASYEWITTTRYRDAESGRFVIE